MKLNLKAAIAACLRNRDGNIAIAFALSLVPLLLAVGCCIDYVRAYNVQAKMQTDLDAALIAAVKDVGSLETDKLQNKVETWFAAQTDLGSNKYSLSDSTIKIDKTGRTIDAIASANVATTFMTLANINSVPVSVRSSVAGPAVSYMNVYLVLDKSASMLLAATASGQSALRAAASCEFACHTSDGTYSYNGQTFTNVYDLAKAMGVTLRADVSVDAVKEVLGMVDASNQSASHIKVGLYTLGAAITQVLAPTESVSTAEKFIESDTRLTSATSEDVTFFDVSLPKLTGIVGTAGDGSSPSSPLKLVLLLTDGVQSDRNWVLRNPSKKWECVKTQSTTCVYYNSSYFPSQPMVTPINPKWCDAMKKNGVTVGVLYTEYLAVPLDWGYNMTVGETMKSSSFAKNWGGSIRSNVSANITRHDYIPYALKDCASSEDLFLSASASDDIKSGLSSIFQQYLTSVRLTQ
ncbi:pilus assembly protein [Agrobacterium tumefaciens]|uniref:TadE/TadG family type IV pilus assembly protein n=1 Tax=Agrobacterium tumefaciens TaxID=358 RepID=UPI0015748808|nr:TadE/TadG family type IV pilus assembly protein [Agrobacterium tumefaciens]MCZ7497332.1 pilus assembly protein [Rhizobium rhizogenes]NTE56546.1 pilus assembly protein [Agrobacterium tumefaciens]NTE74514.1 pilus assembly protein [Agrobacterium tumefaciens]